MVTIKDVIEKARTYLPTLNEERVMSAYEFAEEAHRGQKRYSGDPYIIHPLSVAYILLDYHPDEDSIITAILHDVAEDTDRTLDDIEKIFGATIRHLCSGLVKLSKVRSRLNDPQVANLRKLFLAMADDIRVVMLKLCDRLHNMQTLDHVPREKQERIAQETMNVYAPIAARLGIYRLKTELEDLCFKHLQPPVYKDIADQLAKTGKWREKYIGIAKKILKDMLAQEGIQGEVDGRVKGIYSIYRKMQKKNKNSVDDIFDVFAMRIILPDIYKYGKEYTGHLYTALGIVHNNFTPLAYRFKDYVAVPKVNGYRSLHTTVVGLGPKNYTRPTEVQLRTLSMHHSGEFGIAAHWIYEEKGVLTTGSKDVHLKKKQLEDVVIDRDEELFEQQREWISDLRTLEQEAQNNQELLSDLQSDVLHDRIFVLTPRGDVKDLPAGATPVDFSYAVHTEVGNHCIGARVNGTIVPIDYVLHNGEVVEIITRKNAGPRQSWLTFVKTTHARNRIKAWFRTLDEQRNIRDGRGLINEKLHQLGKAPLDMTLSLLKNYEGRRLTRKQREGVLAEVGQGTLLPSTVIKKLFTLEELLGARGVQKDLGDDKRVPGKVFINKKELKRERAKRGETGVPQLQVLIGGMSQVPYRFVKCCKASLNESLVGFITRGKGVSLHKKDCTVIRNSDPYRLVPVTVLDPTKQKSALPNTYAVQILVEVEDRLGLVRDISGVIAQQGVNILYFYQDPAEKSVAKINFVLEIENIDQLDKLLSYIEKVPNVRRACKVN